MSKFLFSILGNSPGAVRVALFSERSPISSAKSKLRDICKNRRLTLAQKSSDNHYLCHKRFREIG